MKLSLKKIFQNKYLLYVVLVVAVTNVLGYLAKEKYNSVTFFLALGLLSSYFTKNMTVVLLVAILSTALVSTQGIVEGLEGISDNLKKKEDKKKEEKKNEEENVQCKAKLPADKELCGALEEDQCKSNSKCMWDPILSQPEKDSIKATEAAKKEDVPTPLSAPAVTMDKKMDKKDDSVGEKAKSFMSYCFESLKGKKEGATHMVKDGDNIEYYIKHDYKDGKCPIDSPGNILCEDAASCPDSKFRAVQNNFSNMGKRNNIVANTSRESRVDGVDESEGDRIDYAETTKQAYDNLQAMLGADGMKGLASETKKLVAQQKELVDSLGQMAPVLNSAKSTLDSLNLPDMKGITNILSTLKGK